MKILLDTNAIIWLLSSINGDKLGVKAKQHLQDADMVYASSINVLEIRIKTMLGKLTSSDDLVEKITSAGLVFLPFDTNHADAIRYFPELVRHDPFDRMLLAQAKVENIKLLTSDSVLLNFDKILTINSRR